MRGHSPLGVECVFAVAVLALVIAGSRDAWRSVTEATVFRWGPLLVGLAAVAVPLAGAAGFYFIGDDFFVVMDTAGGRGRELLRALRDAKGEVYYRPIAYWLLSLSAIPLGLDPWSWHVFNLGLHFANCALLYAVALRMGLRSWCAALAMALFGIHGSRPESVVWITGYFELISACCLLLSLRFYLARGKAAYALAMSCFVLAVWSKESAYVLPVLLLLLPWREGETWRRRIRAAGPFFVLAGIAFVHRWVALGGIGGYLIPGTARPEAGAPSLFRVAKLLAARLWAPLFIPVNWEVAPGALLVIAMTGMAVALFYAARYPARKSLIVFALAATALSALPASTQLLIGADMQKSRLLYLASAWFAIFLAGMVEAVPAVRFRIGVALALLIFQWSALRHNLAIWDGVSQLSRETCLSAQRLTGDGPREVVAVGLPGSMRGVYFFMNGFAECLDMGRQPGWKATLVPPGTQVTAGAGKTILVWRGEDKGLQRD